MPPSAKWLWLLFNLYNSDKQIFKTVYLMLRTAMLSVWTAECIKWPSTQVWQVYRPTANLRCAIRSQHGVMQRHALSWRRYFPSRKYITIYTYAYTQRRRLTRFYKRLLCTIAIYASFSISVWYISSFIANSYAVCKQNTVCL